MPTVQYQVAGNQNQRSKTSRRPLQPKNFPANPIDDCAKTKPKSEWIGDSNKENHPICATPTPMMIESFDASLAEELSAIRKKVERLRLDREKTVKMLTERDVVLEMKVKEMEQRGEAQRKLEIEVDRLYRLKELKSYCMRVSPIRSLREKEREKKIQEDLKDGDREESMDESALQSPSSELAEEK